MGSWQDIFEDLRKRARLLDQQNRITARSTQSLADALEEVGDGAKVAGGDISTLANSVDVFKRAVSGSIDVLGKLTEQNRKYQTTARLALRGTTLLTTGTKGLQTAYLNLEVSANRIAQASGSSIEESTNMAAALGNAVRQAGSRVNITAAQLEDLGEKTSILGKFAGMGIEQIGEAGSMMVRDLGLSSAHITSIMEEAVGAASAFGVSGTKVFALIQERMEEIQALDVEERAAYLKKLVLVAGLQEKASVNFGKYTDRLTSKKGVDALVNAAVLSSITGADQGEILRAMANKDGMMLDKRTGKMVTGAQYITSIKAAGAEGLAPGAIETQKRLRSGNGTIEDAFQVNQAEIIFGALSDRTGIESVEDAAQAKAATDRLNMVGDAAASLQAATDSVRNSLPAMVDTGLSGEEKRDQHVAWLEKEMKGLGSAVMDKASDAYWAVARWEETANYVLDLGKAAYGAAAGLLSMGQALAGIVGRMSGGMGGFPMLIGNLGNMGRGMAAAAGPFLKFAGVAGVAVEALGTLSKVSTEAGRSQMLSEIEMASEAEGVTGFISNFGTALLNPTESLVKMGMMIDDLTSNWWDRKKEADKTLQDSNDKTYFKSQALGAQRAELRKTEEGKAVYGVWDEAKRLQEQHLNGLISAEWTQGQVHRGQKGGKSSDVILAELEKVAKTLIMNKGSTDPKVIAETDALKKQLNRDSLEFEDRRARLETGRGLDTYRAEAQEKNRGEKWLKDSEKAKENEKRIKERNQDLEASGYGMPPVGLSPASMAGRSRDVGSLPSVAGPTAAPSSIAGRLAPDLGNLMAPASQLLQQGQDEVSRGMERALSSVSNIQGMRPPIIPDRVQASASPVPDLSPVSIISEPPPPAGASPDLRAALQLLAEANRSLRELVSLQTTGEMLQVS